MEIKLSRWQTVVLDDPHRFKVINVGRRAGKTLLAIIKILQFSENNPKQTIWYVAPTYKQAKQIAFEMIKEIAPKGFFLKINETELSFVTRSGVRIFLKGADNPDSLRGVKIDLLILDEVAFWDKWELAWKVLSPTLVDTRADCWFISTPNGFNHFKHLADKQNDDYKYFHFTSYDNPYISKEELDQQRQQMDSDSFAQEYLGEFRKMSGLVYKTFNREIHLVDVPYLDSNYTFTRVIDFGYAHKQCLIYFAISPDGTAIYGYDGFYKSGVAIDETVEVCRLKDKGKVITNPLADSASPTMIAELIQRGIHFNPVSKSPDSVMTGIRKVEDLLKVRNDTGKPTLMFSKDLTWIADEFEGYRFIQNDGDDKFIKEVPIKRNDDAMDTIRYFALNYRTDDGDFGEINVDSDDSW